MKTLLILGITLLGFLTTNGQVFHRDSVGLPALNGEVGMQEVIQMDSVSKKEMYNRAKLWTAQAFKSAKNVIQMDDAENGVLILKGLTTMETKVLFTMTSMDVKFTLKLEMKDGRYRYTLAHIAVAEIEEPAEKYWGKLYKNYRAPLVKSLQDVIDMMKKGMQTPVSSDKW